MSSKKTTYSSKNGLFTGKQVTTKYSDGSSKRDNYRVASRSVFGPSFKAASTTYRDSKGNTRTKTYR